jgi:hypothetical protein
MDVSMSMSGASELSAKLASAPAIARTGTVAGTKAAQRIVIKSVRSKLNGPPRWGHRGKSRVYSASIDRGNRRGTGGSGGTPGRFTGALRKGVGGKRKPIVVGPGVVGGVGIGGAVNNLKKGRLEQRFPFFAKAVHEVEPGLPAVYAAAWGAALAKLR